MNGEKDIVMDSYVKSKLGIGLPPRRDPDSEGRTSPEPDAPEPGTDISTLVDNEKARGDRDYIEQVIRDMGEDLDSMLSTIEDYKHPIGRFGKEK